MFASIRHADCMSVVLFVAAVLFVSSVAVLIVMVKSQQPMAQAVKLPSSSGQ